MKRTVLYSLFLLAFAGNAQTKLYLDSTLKATYIAKYPFSDGLTCIPFYCDPFYAKSIKPADTAMCGKFVFVNPAFEVKIRPVFQMPCTFEPKFSEGLCAVNIDNEIVFIDTTGAVKINTHLLACSSHKNRVLPFRNNKAKIYKGSGTARNYFDIYYIDRKGKRIPETILVKVKEKPVLIVANTVISNDNASSTGSTNTAVANTDSTRVINTEATTVVATSDDNEENTYSTPVYEERKVAVKNKYHAEPLDAAMLLKMRPHRDNRMLLYYNCDAYQLENMADDDTVYCGKFVFTDTFFNVRINAGFQLPCSFEPEFAEGLCAIGVDSQIVYIDTAGRVVIKTNLASCNGEQNKASTFKNGIATLYHGDKNVHGLYTTIAINTFGERVRLLEFEELELAEKKYTKFKNLTLEETTNCFIGRGKSNGLWFLVEKSGKVKKKLLLK